jgi:hypothetical protein
MNQRETIGLALLLRRLEKFDYSDTQRVVRRAMKSHMDQKPEDVPIEAFAADPAPQDVGDFIRSTTRLYRESWLIPQLKAIVEKYAAKHNIRLDRISGS